MRQIYGKANRIRKKIIVLAGLVLVGVMFFASSGAVEAKAKTVRVGYYLVKGFEEGAEGEYKSGYGYDYLQEIRNYTGWNYEYVYGTWNELADMLERGEIDLMSHVAHTEERNEKYLFSVEPQGTEKHYLYVRADNNAYDSGDYSAMNGKTVGIYVDDFRRTAFEEWCVEQGITCIVKEYADSEQMQQDFASGKIEAVNESRVTISSYPVQSKSIVRFMDQNVYFAVNKNRPDLLEEINEAQRKILAINEFFGTDLQNKYVENANVSILELTEAEKQLLNNYGIFTIGYCENRRPLAFTDKKTGEMSGLIKDYMDTMALTYGVEFETVAYPDENKLIQALLSGEVDIAVPGAYSATTAENHGIVLSNTINEAAMVAVYKGYAGTDTKNIFDKIAVVAGSLSERDYAHRNYPNAILVEAETEEEAIKMVHNGTADSYLVRSSYWSWLSEGRTDLKDLYAVSMKNRASIIAAMRQEDAPLMAILNKSIVLLDDVQRVESIVRYTELGEEPSVWEALRANPITTALLALAIGLTFVLLFVMSRLLTESRYIKKLQVAKDEAEKAKEQAETARRQAEQANLAKSTFMTSMSHDIRTPMNAIIGMTTLAKKHMEDPDYVRNCLNKVTMASNHLLTLINDVLDINKIESGVLSMNATVFSLADSIMNLANISRPQINEKNHRFEIRIHNVGQEYVFADELRINQIFINLLSNAIKYTPVGGKITVDVKAEMIPGESDRMRLYYIVEDNGAGMSEEFQTRMYDIFAMEGNKHGRNASGSGVGLAICKRLVDLLDGTIECESKLGKGTRFTVILDLPVADRLTDHRMLPPIKLLLVDDDEIFRITAADTLKDMGISPDCVDCGEEAVKVVREKHAVDKDYPVIIIDWQMPGMDGIETTREIRKIVGEDVSIIVISAYDSSDIRDVAIQAGANGFISKPFFRSMVYDNLSELLGMGTEEAADEDNVPKLQGMNILVAEDNDFNWEIAREFLAMQGVTSDRAENGRICLDMLDKAEDGTYDMILMDIQMPELNGYETTKAIRAHKRAYIRNLPIIAMTADAFTEDVTRSIEVGMNAHMAKPLSLDQFVEVIAKIHRESELAQYSRH